MLIINLSLYTCLHEIVSKVSRELFRVMPSANSNLIGMKTRVEDLKSLLEIGSRDVRMVGIWGIGGGGKTTLASALYEEVFCNFDGRCMVKNIREESRKYDLEKLQAHILSVLTGQNVDVGTVLGGKNLIKRRLWRKSVLVILDDVDSHDQLDALAGSLDWFGEGSRIIITTRDVEAHGVTMIHNVSLLTNGEAIELFSRHAFRACSPVEGYEELSVNVVSKAGGLPLALKILGSHLCGRNESEWMSALDRLNDTPDCEIINMLKISYDGLKPDEKEMFLDIACFFRRNTGPSKDEAMVIFNACGFHPVIGVKVLVEKALITITDYGGFDMHDVVHEVALYIVRGENPSNPEKHSRVWRREDVQNMCTSDVTTLQENDKIEALKFFYVGYSPRLLEVVANMKKLRFLYVGGSVFDERPVTARKFFSNELRYIFWRGYPASSLPTNFQPKSLSFLDLERSLLKRLWQGRKHLSSLKVLNLRSSGDLIRIPDFAGLTNLEELMLSGCEHLKEIHPSVGYLERLVYLDLQGCGRLEMFPPIIRMKKLETLVLSWTSLREFPEIKGNMDSLRHLDLRFSGIEVVPSSIGQYCTSIVSIGLSYCSRLKSIEGNFRLLNRLKWLELSDCEQLEKLPKDLFELQCDLETLGLSPGRRSLSSVPLIPHLPRLLRNLNLGRCKLEDGEIPSDIGELSNLQVLDLRGNKFSRLHFSLARLSRLKKLNLNGCKRLVELPELPSSLPMLEAYLCNSLETVGDLPTNCKCLSKVAISGNNKVIGGERLLQSMLKRIGIEDHIMSLEFGGLEIPKSFETPLVKGGTFTLQLPQNWYNDYSGFLLCAAMIRITHLQLGIIILEEMDMDDAEYELWQEPNEERYPDPSTLVGYISFSSLRHTKWWNFAYNIISFSVGVRALGMDPISGLDGMDLISGLGVRLVPRRSEGDSTETAKATTDCSEFWDEGNNDNKTFVIDCDQESSLEMRWNKAVWDYD